MPTLSRVRSPVAEMASLSRVEGAGSSRLILVQALRIFAALAVVFYHAQYDAESLAARFGLSYRGSTLLPWPAGVDLFFVISGFIMVHTSRSLFATGDGPRIFLARRIARVVPIYWAIVTIYLLIGQMAPAALNRAAPGWAEILAAYLFIPYPGPNGVLHPVYALGWTLNYEMFFYLVFAGALLLPRHKAIMAVAAVLFGIVAYGRFAQAMSAQVTFWSDPIVLEFVLGMALAVVLEKGWLLPRAARLALVIAALLLLHADLIRSDGAFVLPQVLAYGLPAAMLVAAAVLGPFSSTWLAMDMSVVALGDASYSLYLVHPFAIRALREMFTQSGLAMTLGPQGFVLLALVAAVILALVVCQFLEKPMTRAVRSWFRV
ncbi:acyltransferase family protein [Bosea sp. BH3]|uniref:acyltransferase family protein n=1 Tax=Bosea sp. BH3 TaxID=2871701 RepID=UPI0021CB7A98|nr:acyltransferase [Bosea sp. BH3]MCU4181743.1 acyltransferase [Bosea sp. BH3]